MIHFDLPKEKSSIIKVIGVGGGGSNAVNHMFEQDIEGVNFIICNTDAQSIQTSPVPNKIQLGPHLTQGLGAGANPEIGKQATEESLEEIKRILEVNTKMAFITAGMGGGTGTGGAPIIAQVCKSLGILTVGIVTTPFSYEGRKRQLQAEEGINILKDYVDTLLVISNDKLRHQFGNLKMREAFAKADNVLATAAKCITDVINSTGQINVDFADVCTVMRNGGVAILGSSAVGGENRALKAIEEALNSPLLNDNDIRGARWILININSAEGEHEFTMDEVDIIQQYLLQQAGEGTDVILGLGYDSNLDDKIGITLIATGFEHKDPFKQEVVGAAMPVKQAITSAPLKEVFALHTATNNEVDAVVNAAPPVLPEAPMPTVADALAPSLMDNDYSYDYNNKSVVAPPATTDTSKEVVNLSFEWDVKVDPIPAPDPAPQPVAKAAVVPASPAPNAANGGILARPTNIYAVPPAESRVEPVQPALEKPAKLPKASEDDATDFDMQLVTKDIPATDVPVVAPVSTNVDIPSSMPPAEDLILLDVAEEQRKKAAERVAKLRNLSFNVSASDVNTEMDAVPAYIRRNMELYNTSNFSAEQYYSSMSVRKDDNNLGPISNINSFLDGKKPD